MPRTYELVLLMKWDSELLLRAGGSSGQKSHPRLQYQRIGIYYECFLVLKLRRMPRLPQDLEAILLLHSLVTLIGSFWSHHYLAQNTILPFAYCYLLDHHSKCCSAPSFPFSHWVVCLIIRNKHTIRQSYQFNFPFFDCQCSPSRHRSDARHTIRTKAIFYGRYGRSSVSWYSDHTRCHQTTEANHSKGLSSWKYCTRLRWVEQGPRIGGQADPLYDTWISGPIQSGC